MIHVSRGIRNDNLQRKPPAQNSDILPYRQGKNSSHYACAFLKPRHPTCSATASFPKQERSMALVCTMHSEKICSLIYLLLFS